MNLEIKKKNEKKIDIIDKLNKIKNTVEYMQFEKKENKLEISDNCSCNISSGYYSTDSEIYNINKKLSINSKEINTTDTKSDLKSNIKIIEKNDELSLLDDNYKIDRINYLNKKNNTNNESETSNIIKIEFQDLLKKKDYIHNKNKSNEIKEKLEDIYDKEIIKCNDLNKKKINNYKINNYINLNKIKNEQIPIDNIIKKLSILLEYIFNESTRGWNNNDNLFILQLDKLKNNFEKIIFDTNNPYIKMGFIYRDFNEQKINLEKDYTKYWIGYEINSLDKKISLIKYSIKNKVLFYCLENLTKSKKFKKKINECNYKFIKKTVKIYEQINLTIDIILYLGIKNSV